MPKRWVLVFPGHLHTFQYFWVSTFFSFANCTFCLTSICRFSFLNAISWHKEVSDQDWRTLLLLFVCRQKNKETRCFPVCACTAWCLGQRSILPLMNAKQIEQTCSFFVKCKNAPSEGKQHLRQDATINQQSTNYPLFESHKHFFFVQNSCRNVEIYFLPNNNWKKSDTGQAN